MKAPEKPTVVILVTPSVRKRIDRLQLVPGEYLGSVISRALDALETAQRAPGKSQ